MKKIIRKFSFAILLIALCCFFGAMSASAADATYSYSKKLTIYMPVKAVRSSNSKYYNVDISTSNSISSKIKRSSVKSSEKSVAGIDGASNHDIFLNVKKKGTTTISFKAGSKTYTIKLTVKNHTNPISTLKISGVKNGTNLIGKYKRDSDGLYEISLTKTTKNAKLTVKPKSGWAIKFICLHDNTSGNEIFRKRYDKPTSSKKIYSLGRLKKSKSYSLSIVCENKKNGGTSYEYYILNYNGSYSIITSIE